jgi:hypothetical protein
VGRKFTVVLAGVAVAALTLATTTMAWATTLAVTNTNDSGAGSLLIITDSTVSDNGPASYAGGVYNDGTLTMSGSTVSGNNGGAQGGGFMNDYQGTATITNSTISGNVAGSQLTAGSPGGGIYNTNESVLTLSNSTVTNSSANFGGGIQNNEGSTTTIGGTIVASNTAFNPTNHISFDVFGDFTSQGYNLIGRTDDATGFDRPGDIIGAATSPLNPRLRPLAGNGGPTKSHALSRKSPALNAGDPVCPPPATGT